MVPSSTPVLARVAAPGVDVTDWPTELQLLLGAEAAGILAAVAGVAEGVVQRWSPVQVTYQAGSSAVVQYRADVAWPGGNVTNEMIVAATGKRLPHGADILDDGTTRVGVWRWPHDPAMPGLAAALDPTQVGTLLDRIQLGGRGRPLELRVRAYRPGRRAVVEATGRLGRLFLKVVRPQKVGDLHATHRQLAGHLPVPDSLGWTDGGVLVLPAVPGRSLRDLLKSGRSAVPPPAAVGALLDRLPGNLAERPPRAGLPGSVERCARTIAAVLPAAAGRLDDIQAALADAPLVDHPIVPVHGDLHESQLLVDRGRFSGLIDVDTAGAGVRADDYANFCAHLSVLGQMVEHSKPIRRYGTDLLAHAEQSFDRADLRARVAAGVVGLATGPFRTLERNWPANTLRRLDLALEWLGVPERA